MTNSYRAQKQLLDSLHGDLRLLSTEAKKKFPAVKEAAERGMMNLRTLTTGKDRLDEALAKSDGVLHAFLFGCESRHAKLVHVSLTAIQRLLTHKAIPEFAVGNILNALWGLMENRIEDLKILQTVLVMVTSSSTVHGDQLAKAFVMCFRLHFGRDVVTMNTASASIRQLVCAVFDRVSVQDEASLKETVVKSADAEQQAASPTRMYHRNSPRNLDQPTTDAYLLFQDICQVTNGDSPYWLIGLSNEEGDRSLGLELLETVLSTYVDVFIKHPEFSFLLKERVCPLVIKLFSPSIKHRGSGNAASTLMVERPSFGTSLRLLRIVSVLIKNFYTLLVTECEIFLSLLVKFLDADKPQWQRVMAIEVIHSLCVQPNLLGSFCQYYDMQEHSTKIFRDIINGLGSFVQSLFTSPSTSATATATSAVSSSSSSSALGSPSASSSSLAVGAGSSALPGNAAFSQTAASGFTSGNVSIALHPMPPARAAKPFVLQMLDRVEAPAVQDSYALITAFASLVDTVKSIASLVDEFTSSGGGEKKAKTPGLSLNRDVLQEMINSSWCGLLAALSLLLDACLDETVIESILKSLQVFTNVSGSLDLTTPRDAFLTALCKACLPPRYALMLSTGDGGGGGGGTSSSSVGASGMTTLLPASPQLNGKNLQCMKSLLSVAHCHGGVLGTAWYLVLSTLQHLTELLNLTPSTGGSFKVGKKAKKDSTSALPTSSTLTDFSVLASMLSRLFESSRQLSANSLLSLLDALTRLSNEVMESASISGQSKEPSRFAIAKLLETGLANLCRIETVWDITETHLLKVCGHSHSTLREFASESLACLVRSGITYSQSGDTKPDERTLLRTLQKLSRIEHLDVRQQQLECVLQVLHSSGQSLVDGWSIILDILMQAAQLKGQSVIHVAFQALQLIVTDFVALLPTTCVSHCIQTAGKFGSQRVEVNISLTAIGLLWNISDYLEQSSGGDGDGDAKETDVDRLSDSDQLWLCVFSQLAYLCVDDRPPVRKSAGQTLFSTISQHGQLVTSKGWSGVLRKVLFPMLKDVQDRYEGAAVTPVDVKPGILIHHSRDTEQKQWAETQRLALSGVARVFQSRWSTLKRVDDFAKAWNFMLDVVRASALHASIEISSAALKSLLVLFDVDVDSNDETTLWRDAWTTWRTIGTRYDDGDGETASSPNQGYLTDIVKSFHFLYKHMSEISADDFDSLASVLNRVLAHPIDKDSSLFLVSGSGGAGSPSPLQQACLNAVASVYETVRGRGDSGRLAAKIVGVLLSFALFASRPPLQLPLSGKVAQLATDELNCCVAFGERALRLAGDVYANEKRDEVVVEDAVLEKLLKALRVPLGLKYGCPSESTWTLAVDVLLRLLGDGLETARLAENKRYFEGMWKELGLLLEEFLFCNRLPKTALPVDQRTAHELLDIQVVEMLGKTILPHSQDLPPDFKTKVMELLNRGSVHTADEEFNVSKLNTVLVREQFAKTCFETLLRISFMASGDESSEGGLSELAISTLLRRCHEVMKKFVQDDRHAGKRPLPRSQMGEVSFVFKATESVVSFLKKSPASGNIWSQVTSLYPLLVDCVTCTASDVKPALRDALKQYHDLLTPQCR